MSLYVPHRNRIEDETSAFELIEAHGFATLVTPTDGDCYVTHLPMVLDRDARQLLGHLAAANGHHEHLAGRPSIAIFHGPHAYMSASWYTDASVPTWNYAVSHVHGRATLVDEPALREQLSRLTEQYESPRANPWPGSRAATDKRIARIIGFVLPMERIETKFKLDQQYEDKVIDDLARRLEAEDSGETSNRALARLMRATRET